VDTNTLTNEKAVAGWLIQMTIARSPTEEADTVGSTRTAPRRFKFFNVAISSAEEAVAAVRTKERAAEDVNIRPIRVLSEAEVDALSLMPNEVKPEE
jgi:hypothetical protein